jgi:hypothetical protein
VCHTPGDHGNVPRSELDARSVEVEPDTASNDEGDLLLRVRVPRKNGPRRIQVLHHRLVVAMDDPAINTRKRRLSRNIRPAELLDCA